MSKQKKRKAVVLLNDQMKLAAELLSESECGRLFERLRLYAIEGYESDLTGESRAYHSVYRMMKAAQDESISVYEELCQKNRRNALKRSQPVAAMAASGSEYNRREENRREDMRSSACGDCLSGHEVKGVPGVVWA